MRIDQLKLQSKKSSRRSGRGISSGHGKTAGRGTKGQNSRAGGGVRPGFEGGQNPLSARLPKLAGFKSRRPAKSTVRLGQLNQIKGKVADNSALAEAGLIASPTTPVKVVAGGKLESAKTVKLQSASQSAIKAIESAGGKFEAVPTIRKSSPKPDKKA